MYIDPPNKKPFVAADLEFKEKETPAQKASRLGVPLVPKRPVHQPLHNPVIAVCGECGHEFRGGLEYRSCPLSNCPTGSPVTLN
jgi:hypothetical protein